MCSRTSRPHPPHGRPARSRPGRRTSSRVVRVATTRKPRLGCPPGRPGPGPPAGAATARRMTPGLAIPPCPGTAPSARRRFPAARHGGRRRSRRASRRHPARKRLSPRRPVPASARPPSAVPPSSAPASAAVGQVGRASARPGRPPPGRRQPRPVLAGRCPVAGQPIEGFLDGPQRHAHPLGGTDEGDTTQRLTGIAALVAERAPGGDQTFGLVEMQSRCGYAAARRELADGQLVDVRS